MRSTRWIALGVVAVVAVVGFLLFRPDTIFTDVRAEEDLADAFTDESSQVAVGSGPSTTLTTSSSPASDSSASSPVDDPAAVRTGSFEGIDHEAAGTATLYEQDGRIVLRFEDDTRIQNGPDLYVWLLPAATFEGGIPVEYVDLGTLKGTVGGQNYELPSGFEVEGPWTVLVWCRRFAVPFAAAELG